MNVNMIIRCIDDNKMYKINLVDYAIKYVNSKVWNPIQTVA